MSDAPGVAAPRLHMARHDRPSFELFLPGEKMKRIIDSDDQEQARLEEVLERHAGRDAEDDLSLEALLPIEAVAVPLEGGSLRLGTWQGIFFVELDGPRNRRVLVSVLG